MINTSDVTANETSSKAHVVPHLAAVMVRVGSLDIPVIALDDLTQDLADVALLERVRAK